MLGVSDNKDPVEKYHNKQREVFKSLRKPVCECGSIMTSNGLGGTPRTNGTQDLRIKCSKNNPVLIFPFRDPKPKALCVEFGDESYTIGILVMRR